MGFEDSFWGHGSMYIWMGFSSRIRSFLGADFHSGLRESQEQTQDGGKTQSMGLTF